VSLCRKARLRRSGEASSGNGAPESDDEVVEDADYEVIDEEAKKS